jgi:hypothetical protein
MSAIGATSPGRWQTTQLLYRIGATSFENVGVDDDVSAAPATGARPRHTTRAATVF